MRWVVFANLYVAFCGAALTAATTILLGQPPRLDAVVGLVFCCTLVIYNLDRLVEPHPGDSKHERWVHTRRPALWAITLAAGLGSIAFVTQLNWPARLSLAPAGAVALGYCLPLLPGKPRRRLKEIPGAKLLLIAGVWTYATAGLPMLSTGEPLNLDNATILLARLLFLAAVALPFDLPDIQRDRQSGIATLPTAFGISATKRVAIALAVASALLSLLIPGPASVALLISSALTIALLTALRQDRGVLYFMVALDGMLLLQAALLWAIAD